MSESTNQASYRDAPLLRRLGAAELARRIRVGDTSPLEVVDAHIARIDQVEPHINALITPTFDTARSTARRLTEAGVPADPPPLHGVPVPVKDALAVADVLEREFSGWRMATPG